MPRSGSPTETLPGIGALGSSGVVGGVTGTADGSGTGSVGRVVSGGSTGGVTVLDTAPIFTLKVLIVVMLLPSSGCTVSKVYSVSETFTTLRTRRCSKPGTGSLTFGRVADGLRPGPLPAVLALDRDALDGLAGFLGREGGEGRGRARRLRRGDRRDPG